MEAQDYVEALCRHGLTQSQIEAETGIPQPHISKILRGAVSDVMSKNYRALQALYETRIPAADRAELEKLASQEVR